MSPSYTATLPPLASVATSTLTPTPTPTASTSTLSSPKMMSIVIPPQFSGLPSDSMASLASAVASSIWHSVPDEPLQQLEQVHARGLSLFPDSVSSVGEPHMCGLAQSPTPPASPTDEFVFPLSSNERCVFGGKIDASSAACSQQQDQSSFTAGVQVVRTMLGATQLSPSVVLVATLYVARLRALVRHAVQAAGSELRVLTVALILAAKWMEDHTYSNASWALVSGMSTRELGVMEFEFLSLLQWDLSVSTVQFATWLSTLTTAATLVFSPTLSPLSSCPMPMSAIGDMSLDQPHTTSEFVLPGAFNTSPLVPTSNLPMTSVDVVANAPASIVAASKRSRTTSSKSMRLRKASSVVMQVLAASQSHLFQAAHETAAVLAAQYPTPAVATAPMELMYPHHYQLQHQLQQQHHQQQQEQLQLATPMAFSQFPTPSTPAVAPSVAQARYHPYHMPSPVAVDTASSAWMHIAGQPQQRVVVPSQPMAVQYQPQVHQHLSSYAYSAPPPTSWMSGQQQY